MSRKATRKKLVALLAAAVTALAALIFAVTFSPNADIPGWSVIFGQAPEDESTDFVRFIDVGQGDSILISSNGYNAMIDTGDNKDDGLALMHSLRGYGITRLDCLILTHFDADHIGGADTVLEQMDVSNIILPKRDGEDSRALSEVDSAIEQSEAAVYDAAVGTVINIGDFELTLVAHYEDEADTNERSIVIMAELDGLKFLFTGDADSSIEERMLEDGLMLDCDVFKAGHHGSRYSNSIRFIRSITPVYAVVSCGDLNSYGHPHTEVLTNFNSVNARVFRTDTDGDVTFYVENGLLVPKTEK